MADLDELNYDDLDELDIETLLARVERKPLTFSRKQNLKQAPEFMQRLSGKDTVVEGDDTQLECIVCAFPRPDLTWYKDSDLILPDHPRMSVVEGEEGKYFLKIKNVCKGDEAGYKCKAENCEGTSASTFFLFVNVKPKRSPKSKNKRRRVSYPPMFSTIVEKVEEEEIAAKEARFAPPSPLSELYVGITLKSRHTWPKFLGEWAFAEDAIRSCSDEAESPPTSPDGTGEKINVKVKVSNKPVKSILKTRRRPEERESSESQKSSKDQPPSKDVPAEKKTPENDTAVTPSTTSASKSSTKRTESRKTTTTTTTTTTKTTKTTSTTKTNGKPTASTDSGQALVSASTAKPAVSTKSETKALESKQQDAISLKGTETKTVGNGSAITTTTTSTTKSNTRTLTAHRIEETRQNVKQQAGRPETKTSPSGGGSGKPSTQEQAAVKKVQSQTNTAETSAKDAAPTAEKKPLSKTQSLQERLIKKTTQTSTSSGKKISTGSLGISKLTEKLTGAPVAQKDTGAVKTSPTKDLKSSPTKVIATTSTTSTTNGQKASSVSQSSTLTASSSSTKTVTQTTKSSATNGAIISNGPLKTVPPTTTAAVGSPTKQPTTVNQSQVVPPPSSSPKQPTQPPPSPLNQPQTTVAQKATTTQKTQVTQKLTTSQTATVPKSVTSPTPPTTMQNTATSTKSTVISSSTTSATAQSTLKTTQVQKPATLSIKANEVRTVEASPTKLVLSPSPTPVKSQNNKSPTPSPNPSPTPIQNQKLNGKGQLLSTTAVKSPVVELPVSHQTVSPQNMALPGKPKPESNDPKYKTTALIKTTQQNQVSGTSTGTPGVQRVTSPTSTSVGASGTQKVTSTAATSVEATKAPRLDRQESVGVVVVNKLVVDQRNQDVRRRRERSPAITHTVTATVRSRETPPATPRTRMRRERSDRGKSPIMQLLPTEPRPKSPVTPQPSVPSPVRYLPIISVKERPTEKVIVHQPTVASKVIDLRGIGNGRPGEIQTSSPKVFVQKSITSQPVEFVKPFGAGKDPIQGLKQTFTTQEMQTQKAETSCDDPKAGIKRSISTEKLHLIDKNTDVIASAVLGPVGAKAAVVDTDVIRTKLITEQPAVPSDRVQPGLVPVQATQKEILTKETMKRTIMEVGKNNLPKGTVMIQKPGSVTTTKMIEAPTRKTSLVESLTNRYNTSTSSSGSASPSYLGTSRSPSRSPSPSKMLHGDNSWQSKPQPTASSQPVGRPDIPLHFKPIDSTPSPQIILSPDESQHEIVLGGSSWNTRQAPVPPKRGSSVERMLTTYNASPTRKTSLQFTPFFSRTEPKKPVDITQYLGHGQSASRLDRSRRAQSEDRLPSIPMYPSRGAMSPPQRPPPPNWSFAAPLNRSVSVDVIPGLVETDRGFSTYQEIPVEHLMSPDSAATLPRRRKRRNSVESLTKMFDTGTPVPVDDPQGGSSNQYQDMGQQLLSQIQAFGDASYDFEEGAATLPRTKDGHGGPRLKRRNSVGHMAKIFDQGVPVVQKDEDAIPIFGESQQCLLQAPINVVHPYTDNAPYNSRPPDVYHQAPLSSRHSASTPHLSSSMSKSPASAQRRTTAINQPQNKISPVATQSRTRRAAACSLNLKNVSGSGSQAKNPSVLNQKPFLQRSLSEQPQSPQKVTLRQHPGKSAEAEEVKSYKRLSVGEAARLFDQKSPESPPQRKNPSLAQKFLAKFK